MGIKVNDVHSGIFMRRRTNSAERDKMLAAEQKWEFAVLQDRFRARFDVFESAFAGAEAQLHITAVKHLDIG